MIIVRFPRRDFSPESLPPFPVCPPSSGAVSASPIITLSKDERPGLAMAPVGSPPPARIHQELENLHNRLCDLDNEINLLRNRLFPVLAPAPSAESAQSSEPIQPPASVAERIGDACVHVCSLICEVGRMGDRLEV